MQIHRLTQIVFSLLQGERVTAKSLAEQFEVSTRTIYRDIEVLSSAGVPIYTDKGNGGGISISENFRLKNAMLSQSEKENIIAMLKAFNAIGENDETTALLNKLSGVFRTTDTCIEVDFSDWQNDGTIQRNFNELRESIINKRVVTMTYCNADGINSVRKVEPLKLIFKHRNWYLYAFCRKRNETRLFKLARIRETKITQETFERVCDKNDIAKNLEWNADNLNVDFTLDKGIAPHIQEIFPGCNYTINNDGNFDVKVAVPYNNFILGWFLSLGDMIKVHQPLWLKDEIRKIHERAAQL